MADNNTAALLHVQSALLMAMCSTHPEPHLLEQQFDFYLQQSLEATSKSTEMQTLAGAWAKTFRARMNREESPPDSG
jgi:hypothetical protein